MYRSVMYYAVMYRIVPGQQWLVVMAARQILAPVPRTHMPAWGTLMTLGAH